MQFKTLALAAVAIAAASTVQAFDNNTCTQCVFGSFQKEPACASLSKEDYTQLTDAFATNNTVNVGGLAAAVQKPATHKCICNWASSAFKPDGTGAAGSCFVATGATPACNATQVKDANDQMAPLVPILKCDAAGNTTSGTPSTTATTTGATASPTKGSSGLQLNLPYVLSVAAIGLAALAGL
ncbi:hypothetical protein EDD11_003259 [Mortierella claussenii]|nr:hypothetical protein EDD11_003259 [Mortierella claussenii]